MSKTNRCVKLFGNPTIDRLTFERKHMVLYDIPQDINDAIKALPNKIYLNKVIQEPLTKVFRELIDKGLHDEIKTYDGCFNIRKQRGSSAISMHSFGIAIDLNAAWNPLIRRIDASQRSAVRAKAVQWSDAFLQVWRDNNFECGADWMSVLDGMHFEFKV